MTSRFNLDPLGFPGYRRYLLATMLASLSLWIYQPALEWTVLRQTGATAAVGFVGAYWRLIVLTVCAVVGVWLSICAYQGYRAWIAAERRHRQQLVARADEQHGWMLAGDDRGVFGAYPPAAL